jgi:hypothetical protein
MRSRPLVLQWQTGWVDAAKPSLASLGHRVYRPGILTGLAATGSPEVCVFSFRDKTGGANRMASDNQEKETDLYVR